MSTLRYGLPANTPLETLLMWPVVAGSPKMSVSAALDSFERHGIAHLPILDQDKRPVGMLSVRDIDRIKSWKPLTPGGLGGMHARAELDLLTVDEIMSKPVVTLPETASVAEVADLINERHLHCVPITAADGTLRGVISAHDLLRAAFPKQTRAAAAVVS